MGTQQAEEFIPTPASLKNETAAGMRWNALARGLRQAITFLVSVILARLLLPEDFGILAMATVFSSFIAVFNSFGTSSAVIHKQDLSEAGLSSIFWFDMLIGLVAAGVTILLAPLVAAFYGQAMITSVLTVLSVGFLFSSISNVQQAIVVKALQFKKLAIIETISVCIGGILAVGLAVRGFGVWSLIAQTLTTTAAISFLLWITSDWWPRITFRLSSIRSILSYSVSLLGSNMVNHLARNMDYLLIGVFLGATPLGYYALAYRLMLYPIQSISDVISRVLFPAFSRIQDDNERFKNAYLSAVKYIGFVTFPLMFGLFVVAPQFIIVVFGPKWSPAIALFRILAFVGMFQSIVTTVGQIYLSKGRTDLMFFWSVLATFVVSVAIYIGLTWGIQGVAIAYAIASFVLIYPNFAIPFRLIGLRFRELVTSLMPGLASSIVMGVVVFLASLVQYQLGIDVRVNLIGNAAIGVLVYIFLANRLSRETLAELRRLVYQRG